VAARPQKDGRDGRRERGRRASGGGVSDEERGIQMSEEECEVEESFAWPTRTRVHVVYQEYASGEGVGVWSVDWQ
jgi:hypothetical protein